MRQGQVIAFSILFLLCAAASAAAWQGDPRNVGGASEPRDAGGTGEGGGAARAGAGGSGRADQGNPSNVGGTAATAGGATGTSTTTSTTASTSSTETTTTTKTKSHKKAVHCTFKGTVVSVDQANMSFVVQPAKGEDVTIEVNDKTKYSPKGKCGWDGIKVGAKVSGTCKKDGVHTLAVSVKCWPAAKAKAEPGAGNPSDVGGTARTGTR